MLVTWFEGFPLYLIANIFFSMISNLLQKVIFLMPILIRDLNRQPPKLVQYGWKASIISQSKKKITKTSINVVFRHSWPGIRVTISRKALVRISWYIPHFEGFCMPVKMQSSICLETKFTPSRLLWQLKCRSLCRKPCASVHFEFITHTPQAGGRAEVPRVSSLLNLRLRLWPRSQERET